MINNLEHPEYKFHLQEWLKWRITYESGRTFINHYLQKLTKRENNDDFNTRKSVTYCPAFAKVAINEIKDSIYERMTDITRESGTSSYQEAITGLNGGVDMEGSSMNYFMGCSVLPELLIMGKVGIYVDMPPIKGPSLLDNQGLRPYIYGYCCEDIQCWNYVDCEYTSVLLKENVYVYDKDTGFPIGTTDRWRRVWRDEDGLIRVAFYGKEDNMTDQYGQLISEPIVLALDRIPFIIIEISESLMTDIADYQIALLNLASSDISYILKANFPFYTEQYDPRVKSQHLRPSGKDTPGEAADGESPKTEEIRVGPTAGRRYPKDMERPNFIHPSSEPLKASMDKQEQLKEEIRLLLKLTIASLRGPKMASAESKQEDTRSLETGLSYIGLTLEDAERKIASLWSQYEGEPKKIPTINYPENYNLRSDEDRRAESKDLEALMTVVPSMTFQKAIGKRIADIMLGSKISREDLKKILSEIDSAPTMTSDPDIIKTDLENALVSTELASKIRGYPAGEVEKAKKDHAERLARISAAQGDPASRGINDASADPLAAAKEKKISVDTTQDPVPTDKTRGGGK